MNGLLQFLFLSKVGVENSKSKKKMMMSRPCMACEVKDTMPDINKKKEEYKMAFKAGVPNTKKAASPTGSDGPSKPLNIPKPKTPFAKKSYSIATLVPPFSLWSGTAGMDYPEHWRLASVYQHSYKPIDTRKKPLIQSVYQ